jgi:hypothetical protein
LEDNIKNDFKGHMDTKHTTGEQATEMDFWRRSVRKSRKKRSEMSPLERSWRCGRTF